MSETEKSGVLPSQVLRAAIEDGQIWSNDGIPDAQVQPASLDLRLGGRAFRVRASFLPGPDAAVDDKIDALAMHEIDLSGPGAVLEKGCVYIVPLMESLELPETVSGIANPKSSTGRLDIFTRLITDNSGEFDAVRAGYEGPLYAEISPRTFSVLVHEGSRLNQLRLRVGNAAYSDQALRDLHARVPLVNAEANITEGGIALTADLEGDENGLVGYKARHHADLIDLDLIDHYDPQDFWEPIHARPGQGLVLNPDDFYILVSREAITVPPDHAAEMVAYDTLVGEFRVHYAGFFDPGFGHAGSGGAGSRAVLEIRSHEVPFMLDHGQVVGRLVYEPLTALPDRVYGVDIGSSYQKQRLKLAKQFRR